MKLLMNVRANREKQKFSSPMSFYVARKYGTRFRVLNSDDLVKNVPQVWPAAWGLVDPRCSQVDNQD